MNALHFFFGVGAFVSPIIVAQAILMTGDITWAYWVLALAHRDLAQYDDAALAIENAIEANSRLLHLYFERAFFALQVADADRAAANYFNVLALDDENIKARIRLCELSSNLAERDTAIDWCSQVTERAPGWSLGWYRLGREYYLKGDYAQAQQSMSRCTTLEVAQGVPIEERTLECWFIQGQAAEGDVRPAGGALREAGDLGQVRRVVQVGEVSARQHWPCDDHRRGGQ